MPVTPLPPYPPLESTQLTSVKGNKLNFNMI